MQPIKTTTTNYERRWFVSLPAVTSGDQRCTARGGSSSTPKVCRPPLPSAALTCAKLVAIKIIGGRVHGARLAEWQEKSLSHALPSEISLMQTTVNGIAGIDRLGMPFFQFLAQRSATSF